MRIPRSTSLLALGVVLLLMMCSCGPFGLIPLAGISAAGGGGDGDKPPPPPTAGFRASPLSGGAPVPVSFTDESTGVIDFYSWDFDNDGTVDSTQRNPNHTYTVAGTYTVRLMVSGPDGTDDETKVNYITAYEPPVAEFTAGTTSGIAPFTVVFTDTSTGYYDSWAWDFDNDSITDATTQNATHTYDIVGTYTVSLTVGGPGGSDTNTKADYIMAVEPFNVISIDPPDSTGGVDVYSPITVVFSKAVDPASVTSATFSVSSSLGPCTGSYYFYDNSTKVVFASSSPLPAGTQIDVALDNISAMANPGWLITGYTSSFATGGMSTSAPSVLGVMPPDGSSVPLDAYMPVRVFFSKPMNTATVNASCFFIYHPSSGTPLSGSVGWDTNFREFTFTPAMSLQINESYEVRVLGTVRSQDGYQMGTDFSSQFGTVDLTPSSVVLPAGPSNPAGYINAATETKVTVRVIPNANTRQGDTVYVYLYDASNSVYAEMSVRTDAPPYVDLTEIDTFILADGPITMEAVILRHEVYSDIASGGGWKDADTPFISLVFPSQIPQYYELRALEMDVYVDSNCDLHLTGGQSDESYIGLGAGTYAVDYDLRVADRNDIEMYATDAAGNESNHILRTIHQRGGTGGGSINGMLRVTVFDSADLSPASGVRVVLGYDLDQELVTDSAGSVTFSNVYSPQTVTVICPGYPILTVCDVDANRISLPLLHEENPPYATVSGSVSPAPLNGMLYPSFWVDWGGSDTDIRDGDYNIHVAPARLYTISAINTGLFGIGFANFTMESSLGPLSEGQSVTENLNFPSPVQPVTRADSGWISLPSDCHLPAPLFWKGGSCFILSRTRSEFGRFLCGYGTFPLDPGSSVFEYSTIQPGYYRTPADKHPSDEYYVLLRFVDIYDREIQASRKFNSGGPLPDFYDVPGFPKLQEPGTGGVITTKTPTFQWDDSNYSGIYTLQIANLDTGAFWIVVKAASGHTAVTLPRIPASSPVNVFEYSYPAAHLMWRVESNHIPGFDIHDMTSVEIELGSEYNIKSEWRNLTLWNPSDTGGQVPEFGAAGELNGTMLVTVVDMETQAPIQGATVFLGDSSAGALLTDSRGQVTFNGIGGPQKVTVADHFWIPDRTDIMMTIDKVESAYVTIPLFSDFDGPEYTLYGEVINLPDSDGWVNAPDYSGEWFNIYDNSASGLWDDRSNTPYDGPSPENYSLMAYDEETYVVLTGFQGYWPTANNIFENAYFSDIFSPVPSGSPPYYQAPTINAAVSMASGFSPIRYTTDPSEVRMPNNLSGGATIDDVWLQPTGVTTYNGEKVYVEIGRGAASVSGDPNLYYYGITFAVPPNFNLDSLGLTIEGEGTNSDGTEWESMIILRHLAYYPRKYDCTLPPVPYPIDPWCGKTGVGTTPYLTWENSASGEGGMYMLAFMRPWPRQFMWMMLTPIDQSGPTASFRVPQAPPGFWGPEIGIMQGYMVSGQLVPGFDSKSWCGDIFEHCSSGEIDWQDGYFTP